MSDEEITEVDQEEKDYDEAENRAEINQDAAEAYGAPQQEEKINQYTITREAIHRKDSLKTTILTAQELGRPLFSVRFYLDAANLGKIHRSPLIEKYFKDKVQNIAASGMSRDGFIMKLNVTNRRDVTRRHERKNDTDPRGDV